MMVRFPEGAKEFPLLPNVQSASVSHTVFYTVGIRGAFSGSKATSRGGGGGVKLPTLSFAFMGYTDLLHLMYVPYHTIAFFYMTYEIKKCTFRTKL